MRAESHRWAMLWVCLGAVFLVLGIPSAFGVTMVTRYAYNSYQLMNSDGSEALADGSWIQIIGSADATIDSMEPYADGYAANTTTGDDVILAYTRVLVDGYFTTEFSYDVDSISYLYIRFFSNKNDNAWTTFDWGVTWWGVSVPVFATNRNPQNPWLDFASTTNLFADEEDHLYVIPEPGTGGLFLLAGALGVAFLLSAKRERKERKIYEN